MNQLALFSFPITQSREVLSVRDLPADSQPGYRLRQLGPTALSNAELLQLVGRFQYLDTASRILANAESLAGLARMSVTELAELPEVGPATATAIRAALELGRRLMGEPDGEAPQIRSPADAANLLLPQLQTLEQEHLVTVILNTRNRVLTIHTVYIGSLNTSLVRVGELFREAIRRNGAAILVAHNHPSGDPNPSPEDIAVTRQIVEAGKLMDIEVLDHLVIGRGRFVSLKERGLGF